MGYIEKMKKCHACSHELSLSEKTGRKDECPSCHADLHCCLNCRFYDQRASKQCREPVAEPVREKQKANYCDYFFFAETRADSAPDTAARARSQLNDLFKP
jgi:hypothetical protein